MELSRFRNRNFLFLGVYDEQSGRQRFHVLDTANEFFQFLDFQLQLDDFFLGKQLKGAVLFHFAKLSQSVDSAGDGLKVCEHAAEPTGVDKVHTAAFRFFSDRIAGLLLGADKENLAAVLSGVTDKHIRFVQFLDGFLQVDDVNAVSLSENVRCHFRVPSSGLVTKVYASFQKLFHRYYSHSSPPKFGYLVRVSPAILRTIIAALPIQFGTLRSENVRA